MGHKVKGLRGIIGQVGASLGREMLGQISDLKRLGCSWNCR